MAYSKANHFESKTYSQAFWCKALSHPARITLLTHLLDHGKTPFFVLAKKIPLAKTTVSQHLRSLRESGLIISSEKYPHTYYQLNQSICKELAENMNALERAFFTSASIPINPES